MNKVVLMGTVVGFTDEYMLIHIDDDDYEIYLSEKILAKVKTCNPKLVGITGRLYKSMNGIEIYGEKVSIL